MLLVRPKNDETERQLLAIIGDEGFRLFFPLAALHAALWPLFWVAAFGLSIPLSTSIPPGFWHAHEMIVGSFGAALIGFLTTAVPEWTDTPRLRGRALVVLATLWGSARVIGFLGLDSAIILAAILDSAWIALLITYVIRASVIKRTKRHSTFVFWLVLFLVAELAARYAMAIPDAGVQNAHRLVHLPGLVFLGILGVALARITVPVTNLVLDPTQKTSPFRPHPGRLNLAPGLVAIAAFGELLGLSLPISGYLLIAAGAAFMDRTAEHFVGREFFRAEILALAGASTFAGLGLILMGANRLGLGVAANAGLHLALMGGLGLGVLAVFSIAGLRHTGQPLGLARGTRLALVFATLAVLLRVVPEVYATTVLPSPPFLVVSLLWATAFLLWLKTYWPFIRDPSTLHPEGC